MWEKLTDEEREFSVLKPDVAYVSEGSTYVLGFPEFPLNRNGFRSIDVVELCDLFDLEYVYGNRNYWDYWYIIKWYTNSLGVRVHVEGRTYLRYTDEPPLYEIGELKEN
jgi:hypothetical protein